MGVIHPIVRHAVPSGVARHVGSEFLLGLGHDTRPIGLALATRDHGVDFLSRISDDISDLPHAWLS
jgi:hypothetical protein